MSLQGWSRAGGFQQLSRSWHSSFVGQEGVGGHGSSTPGPSAPGFCAASPLALAFFRPRIFCCLCPGATGKPLHPLNKHRRGCAALLSAGCLPWGAAGWGCAAGAEHNSSTGALPPAAAQTAQGRESLSLPPGFLQPPFSQNLGPSPSGRSTTPSNGRSPWPPAPPYSQPAPEKPLGRAQHQPRLLRCRF